MIHFGCVCVCRRRRRRVCSSFSQCVSISISKSEYWFACDSFDHVFSCSTEFDRWICPISVLLNPQRWINSRFLFSGFSFFFNVFLLVRSFVQSNGIDYLSINILIRSNVWKKNHFERFDHASQMFTFFIIFQFTAPIFQHLSTFSLEFIDLVFPLNSCHS